MGARRLPGRLSAAEVAVVLGFSTHDIPVLVAKGIIKPLGNPTQNAPKYFTSVEVERIAKDASTLNRATLAVTNYWRLKNARKTRDERISRGVATN